MFTKLAYLLFMIFAAFSTENEHNEASLHNKEKSLLHHLLQKLKQEEEGRIEKRVKTAEKDLQEAQRSVCVQKKLEQRSCAQGVWQKQERSFQKRVKVAEKKLQKVQESVYAQKKSLQELEENLKRIELSSCEREQRLSPRKKNIDSDKINVNESEKLKEMTNTDDKWSRVKHAKFLNLYPNKSAINVYRGMQSNEIWWEDPKNLVGDEIKKSIESSLKQKGKLMSNGLFDCLSNWLPPAGGKAFFSELLFFMSKSVGIDRRGKHKKTPLMVATCFEAERAVVQLIERGANIEEVDEYGTTALHFAAIIGSKSICNILRQNGVNVNAQNKDGYTPLMLAVNFERVEVAQLLLLCGAYIEKKDKYGNAAFTCHKLDAKMWQVSRAHMLPRRTVLAKLKN
jgi:hypothetical protein